MKFCMLCSIVFHFCTIKQYKTKQKKNEKFVQKEKGEIDTKNLTITNAASSK